ncbi:MAG TPA: hypothetical protein VFG71_13145 [Nitrospiraceae bacterium]|nr:hypothetical protein [Nitrospiraceae bacterium]
MGRVRARLAEGYRVRVRRKTSRTHEFIVIASDKLKLVPCPKGWMSPEGYNRYLKTTLAKMRKRAATVNHRRKR